MEDTKLPLAEPVNSTSSLDAVDTQVSTASYASGPMYPTDDLEVHEPGTQKAAPDGIARTFKTTPLSRRRALIVSLAITLLVVLLTGASGVFFMRNSDPLPTNSSLTGVTTQDVNLEPSTPEGLVSELQGANEALLVNGDVITRGDLSLVSNGFTTVLRPQNITANQTYVLPNASGTFCLSSNNCGFVSQADLDQLQNQLGQVAQPSDDVDVSLLNNQSGALTIQGTSNQIAVSTNNGVITLSTPQSIGTISSPTFSSLLLTNSFTVNGAINTSLDCTSFANNGALTTNGSGQIICSDDDGGSSGVSTPGGTGGVLAVFTAGQTIADSIISQALGTVTVAGSLSVTGSLSANSLSLVTALSVANGGTGGTSHTSNGVLVGNGAGAISATSAPTAGQVLIGNAGGVPTFISLSGDVLVSGAGATTIQANSIALSVDTTGNYVASLVAGNGISVGVAAEGGTPTVALSALTADWNQTGAFDLVLNNANSELRVLESNGGVFFGSVDVDDLTADRTYTLPDNSGTVCLDSGNCVGGAGGAPNSASYLTVANNATLTGERAITTGTNLSAVDGGANGSYTFSVINNPSFSGLVTANGGISLGTQTLQGTTGVIDFTNFDVDGSGNVSANALTLGTALGVGSGGTGQTSLTLNSVLLGNGAGGIGNTLAPTSGQILVGSAGGVPTFVSASGDISIASTGLTSIQADSVALGTDTSGNYVASLTAGNGISVGAAGEGVNAAVGLSALTANWNQTGAFDLVLNNASSELRVLESVGGTFFGSLDVDDLSADRTYTLPDSDGTVCLDSGNCVGGAGGAPNTAAYLTIGNNATLTGERAITAGTNLSVVDGGANSTYTLNVVSNPTFSGIVTASGGINLGGQTLQGTTAIIDFNNFDVDGSGNITNTGTVNGQTISSNASFSGDLTVSSILQINGNSLLGDSSADAITFAGTIQGSTPFVLEGATSNTHQISIAVADPSADRTYTIPFVSGNADFCLSTGNCAGSGGGVTTSGGTTNRVAKFTGAQSLGDSTITDDGTDVSVSGDFTLQGGGLTIGTLTQPGSLVLHDGNGETISLTMPDVGSSYSLILPSGVGAANQCLKAQDGTGTLFWDACLGGGGGGGGVSSVDGQSGPSVSINNATGSANVITIDDAAADGTTKGIAAFNATNFTASSGVINTAQNINTGAAPSFAGLSLTGNIQLNANVLQGTTAAIDFTNFDVASNGNTAVGGTISVTGSSSLLGGALARGLTVDTATGTDDRIVIAVTPGGIARADGTITSANLTGTRTWTLPNVSGDFITTGNLTDITTTGIVTSGTWQASAIADTYIADTLTVDGSSTVDWTALSNYPAACAAGQAITQLGDSVTCTTFAAGSGSGNYIQNQNSSQQTGSNFWISGTGRADTSILSPLVDAATATTLNLGTTNANALSVSRTGVTSTVNGALTVAEATTLNAGVTASGGAISLAGSGASSFTSNATLTLQATSALGVSTANNAGGNTAGISIISGNAGAGQAGNISIDNGTSTSGTPAVFFGTNNARAVSIGNSTAATITTINGGTGGGAISLQAGASGTLTIGTTNSNSITIGNSGGSVALNGAVTVAANFTVTNAGNVAFQRGADFSTTGSSDNVNFGTGALFRLTGASAQAITGIAGGVDGRMITLVNAAGQAATLSNNSGSSSVGNRIITGTGTDLTLESGASITLTYDSAATVWRVVGGVASAAAVGANAALSNLASVAINTSLLTGADNTTDLGSSSFSWRTAYADTSVLTPLVDTASAAALNIGTTNASSVALSRSGVTTTVNGALAVTEAITASSTYNTNTFTSTNLTFGGAGATTIAAANNQNLTLQATGVGALMLSSGSGAVSSTSDITFATGSDRTLSVQAQSTSNTAGNNLTVQSATGNGTGAGGNITLQAGTSGSGATGNGGVTTVRGGNAASTNGNGGDIVLTPGTKTGSGTSGGVLIQPAASNDAVNTLALKNSSGTTILRVGSADQTVLPNLATNGSAEQNTTNWVARSGTTMNRTSTFANTGSYSISAATNAVDEGVNYSLPNLANGTYIFTAYVRGTISSTVELGYSADGSTHTSCGATESYTSGGWRIVKCGSFVATGWNSSAFIYIRVNSATNQTIYIDGLQLASGTNVPSFANGTLQIDGMITSRLNLMTAEDSESAFSVQSANGNGVFSINTESPAVGIGLDQPNAMLHVSRLARDDLLRVSANGTTLFNVFEDGSNTRFSFTSGNNNTTAFRVMNASSNSALTVDTTNNQIIIDAATQYTQRLCHSGADGAAQNNVTLGDCNSAGQADLAEMYETVGTAEPGDVVVTKGAYSVGRSDSPYQNGAIGIISTNPVADGIIGNNVTSASRQPVALAGRVPVKVSLENGPINKGDYLAASSTPGFAMKATATGRVIGVALEDYTGTEPRVSALVSAEEVARDTAHAGVLTSYRSDPANWPADTAKIMAFVNASFYVPPTAGVLQSTDMSLTGNAIINGNTTIGANLNVSGSTTLANLTVTGDALIQGSLEVAGDVTTQNITVNGHIITAGSVPQVIPGVGVGVGNLQQNIAAPIVAIEGNDTSGTITITAGTNTTADELTKLTFTSQFTAKPRVVLTAANRDSAKLGAYYDASTTSQNSFSIMSDQVPEAGKTYVFTYFIVQ